MAARICVFTLSDAKHIKVEVFQYADRVISVGIDIVISAIW